VRDYWRGAQNTLGEFAFRFTGSSDLYEATGRRPFASINFVTAHDGFTLHDLVSYNEKHNEANGEDDRDGDRFNRSWNFGVEGPTDDPAINALRARQKRNFLATLMLSQGVPMLLAGDEIGRAQRGNNNAYCQDNEISWLDWANADGELLQFTRGLIALRRDHPNFRRRRWFHGRAIHGSGVTDILWFRLDGKPMSEDHWAEADAKSLGVFLNGHDLGTDALGVTVRDDTFAVLFNARPEAVIFALPAAGDWGRRWVEVINTRHARVGDGGTHEAGGSIPMAELSLMVLRRVD
jgi:glycogen operon protein